MAGPLLTSTGALRLGGNSIWGEYFPGRIDEVRIYNRALSAAEIQTDMNTAIGGPDTTPPVLSGGAPSGVLPAGTTATTLSVATNENATCRYATTPGVSYESMSGVFTTTGGLSHAATIAGLANGGSYAFYIRCADGTNNATMNDYVVEFAVAMPDAIPPTVTLSAPANGAAVSGTVTVSATASDNVGVVGVQFLLNGTPLGAEDTSTPYSISWATASVANGGPYLLSARARDAAGNQTTSSAVSVTVNNTAAPNLVAAYGFDEGTGTTLTDNSGRGHTGTISGATWATAGRFGNALTFDGVNDWVTVADANALDLTTGMTLEAWVYPTASGGGSWRTVLIEGAAGRRGVQPVRQRRHQRAGGVCGAGGAAGNRWTRAGRRRAAEHVVAPGGDVRQDDAAAVRERDAGGDAGGGGADADVERRAADGRQQPLGRVFPGRIDEVRIYNRALTAAEIQTDMNTPVVP